MNLQSDAVIINQCDRLAYEEMKIAGHGGSAEADPREEYLIRYYSFPERGIGRSRNEAILRAEGDICLFSDADIVYEDGYETAILAEFERNPEADMIIFNITVEEERRTYHITERKRVRWYNCGRYGAVSFAIRRDRLLESGITFSPPVRRRCEIQQRRGQPVFDRIHKKRIPRLHCAGDHRQGRSGRIQLVSGL